MKDSTCKEQQEAVRDAKSTFHRHRCHLWRGRLFPLGTALLLVQAVMKAASVEAAHALRQAAAAVRASSSHAHYSSVQLRTKQRTKLPQVLQGLS